jgi:hypothetical protein
VGFRSSSGRHSGILGAHAQVQADRLVTRDRGFYQTYFPNLAVLDPSKG